MSTERHSRKAATPMEEKRLLFEISTLSLDDPAEKRRNASNGGIFRVVLSPTGRELLGSTLFWIGFGLFGWFFPRALGHRDKSYLSRVPPYQVVGGSNSDATVILDFELSQPLVDPPIVDTFLLRITSITFPLIFLVAHAWYSHTGADAGSGSALPTRTASTILRLHRIATVISAFSAAIGMAEGTTVLIKQWVKRRRPNFYALCAFDIFQRKCTSSPDHIKEAQLSFPSGHSSLTCCGMVFLVWYLHATKPRSGWLSSRFFSLVVCTSLPVGWTLFVAASRLVDHWHHPPDILAGLALGFTASTIAYHHWYPPIWSPNAGVPLALLSKGNSADDYGITTNGGATSSVAGSSTATTTTEMNGAVRRNTGEFVTITLDA